MTDIDKILYSVAEGWYIWGVTQASYVFNCNKVLLCIFYTMSTDWMIIWIRLLVSVNVSLAVAWKGEVWLVIIKHLFNKLIQDLPHSDILYCTQLNSSI